MLSRWAVNVANHLKVLMKLIHVYAAVLVLASSVSASATVVYENGIDLNPWGANNPFTSRLVTQNFTLANDAVVNSLTFNAYTADDTVPTTDVLVKFFMTDGDAMGAELFSGHFNVADQSVVGGDGYYSYTDFSVNLPSVTLTAGNYFLGLQVGPSQWNMHWSFANTPNPGVVASDGGSYYFRLEDAAMGATVAAVPEPESYALVCGGLAVMCAVSRRKKVPA